MRTVTVYAVDWHEAPFGSVHAPTLEDARRFAREEAEKGGRRAEIRRERVPKVPAREITCALLNHEGYAVESELVETYVPENVVVDYFEEGGPRWSYRVEGRDDG